MTSPTQIGLRRAFCSLALLACVTMFAPQPTAARGGSEDACVRWTQKQLVIGNDLQSRRFVLEPKGGLEEMPFFRVAEGRAVYHKPFSLSLDLVDGKVGIFVSNDPRAFLLARDESSQPLRIPVFFVGRPRESLEELRDNAESLVFDPSAPLDVGSDFSQVTFRLRRGGSHFDVIRPFFTCGLAGLLVCEESCPEDLDTLAASLVNLIVRGEPGTREEANAPPATESRRSRSGPPPALPAFKPRPAQRFTKAPSSPPEELEQAPLPPPRVRSSENAAPPAKPENCPACPPPATRAETPAQAKKPEPSAPSQAQPQATTPQPSKEAAPPSAQTQPPKNEAQPSKGEATTPAQPPETAAQPKGEATPPSASRAQPPENGAPAAKAPQTEPTPQAKAPEAAPPSTPSPPLPRHIVLAFERKNGEAIPAADVIQAEGSLNVEGVPLQAASEGLTADLPAEAAKKADDAAYLKKLLRRYQLVTVRKEPDRIVLVVEPLYVRAEDLKIEIHDAAGDPVRGCELALDVSSDRRLGEGWSKLGDKERLHGLEFAETDSHYGLNLPVDVEPNELLISTAEPGNVARLSNIGSGCQLEVRPWVTAEELRSGKIARSLKGAGQTLIAVFSTDSSFAGSMGPAGPRPQRDFGRTPSGS